MLKKMLPTLVGLFPVIAWGLSVPIFRVIVDHIGLFAAMGFGSFGAAMFGFAYRVLWRKPFPGRAVFSNPVFHGRWVLYILHAGFNNIGISLVQKQHLPFLILINYLWPTAIIVCSILIAGIKITRRWALIAGSLIILASMAIEVVGPDGFAPDLFASTKDCVAYAIMLAGALLWGLYCALSRRGGNSDGGNASTPFFQLTLGGLALPLSFLPGMATWGNVTEWGLLLLCLYCFVQFLVHLSWDYSIRHGNIVVLSLMCDFIPWLSLLTTNVLLGVGIGQKTVASAIGLVCGAMITRYGTLPKKIRLKDVPEMADV